MLSIFDEITWDAFCVMWRLVGNEILQTKGSS